MTDADPNTPLALALIGGAALCAFMAARSWPQAGGKAARPAAYAQSILQGDPLPEGPAPGNATGGIEKGLAAILSVWVLSKIAGAFGNVPQIFGGGGEGEGGGEEPPVVEPEGGGDVGILGDLGAALGEGVA